LGHDTDAATALAIDPCRLATARSVSRGSLALRASPETSRSNCRLLVRRLISIEGQSVPIAASRCYLIQMLRSALTCANGCFCWSPDEEN